MKTTIALLGAFLLAFACLPAQAEQRQDICAKYMTAQGWSKPYEVNATVLSGFELNQKTQSMNYAPISQYVVIFWAQHQATIIELSLPFISVAPQDGRDADGRVWDITTGGFCT